MDERPILDRGQIRMTSSEAELLKFYDGKKSPSLAGADRVIFVDELPLGATGPISWAETQTTRDPQRTFLLRRGSRMKHQSNSPPICKRASDRRPKSPRPRPRTLGAKPR